MVETMASVAHSCARHAPKVLLYVQHLVGIGHLRRMATVAGALATSGASPLLISGGYADRQPLPAGVRLLQLPAARAQDTRYRALLDENGGVVDASWQRQRCQQLLSQVRRFAPDAVVIETYPFGRGLLRFELEPLCESLRRMSPRPKVWCSVRDVLEEKRDRKRNARILDTLHRYFDAILVHADPAVVQLQHSFPLAHRIAIDIHYTGYVRESRPTAASRAGTWADTAGEIVVSAGGGAVGHDLLRVALEARALSAARHLRWRILCGGALSQAATAWAAQTPRSVIVEPNRDDFPQLLERAALSISQAGYNTVVNILAAGVRSIVAPFAAHGQREQSRRAALLAAYGRVQSLAANTLTAATLAAAVDRALLQEPERQPPSIDLQGAQKSAALVASST